MKKITSKKLSTRLAQYSALTLAIAGVSDATGQIIYTDIDPDETISGSNYLLDLDGDGQIDYDLIARSDVPAVRVYNDESNSILGINAGGNYNYPSALNMGDAISNGGGFLAASVYQTLNWGGCAYTSSQWCDGQVDKYLGLRFDVSGAQHYGWALLDLPADGSNFTIKGYAYNSVAGEGILAGDEGVLSVGEELFENFEFYTANEVLTMKAATAMENIVLYNINGQVVLDRALTSTTEAIDLSAQATGIYIAKVTIDGAEKSFKITK